MPPPPTSSMRRVWMPVAQPCVDRSGRCDTLPVSDGEGVPTPPMLDAPLMYMSLQRDAVAPTIHNPRGEVKDRLRRTGVFGLLSAGERA